MIRQHCICLAQLKLRHFICLNDAYLTTNLFGKEPNDLSLWTTEADFREPRKETMTSCVWQTTLVTQPAGKSVIGQVF